MSRAEPPDGRAVGAPLSALICGDAPCRTCAPRLFRRRVSIFRRLLQRLLDAQSVSAPSENKEKTNVTTITRNPVVFTLPVTTDSIPPGEYHGYIERMTIMLRGIPKTQISRAMLHLTREQHPECFSPNNSIVAIDANVTKHVLNGSITYR